MSAVLTIGSKILTSACMTAVIVFWSAAEAWVAPSHTRGDASAAAFSATRSDLLRCDTMSNISVLLFWPVQLAPPARPRRALPRPLAPSAPLPSEPSPAPIAPLAMFPRLKTSQGRWDAQNVGMRSMFFLLPPGAAGGPRGTAHMASLRNARPVDAY